MADLVREGSVANSPSAVDAPSPKADDHDGRMGPFLMPNGRLASRANEYSTR